jgi:8-oxo-dGTP diphosphatase
MQEYVNGVVIDKAGRTLLIRKNRPAWQKGKLNGVGGHVEAGELPIDAMVREFREETGLSLSEDWTHRITLQGPNFKVHFFICYDSFKGWQQTTDEELVEVDILDLPLDIIPNMRWVIPLLMDKHVAAPLILNDVTANKD